VWKAKSRLPTLSTSPLGISPKDGEIPTFPQPTRRGPEKWETKTRFSTFPSPLRDDIYGSLICKPGSLRLQDPAASRRRKEDLSRRPVFRIILYWNQTPISGSFFDWKMLGRWFRMSPRLCQHRKPLSDCTCKLDEHPVLFVRFRRTEPKVRVVAKLEKEDAGGSSRKETGRNTANWRPTGRESQADAPEAAQ